MRHWDKVVGYDFKSISQGFCYFHGIKRVTYRFQAGIIWKSTQNVLTPRFVGLLSQIGHWDNIVDYDFESFSPGFWIHSGAKEAYMPVSEQYNIKLGPNDRYSSTFRLFNTIANWDIMFGYILNLFFKVSEYIQGLERVTSRFILT